MDLIEKKQLQLKNILQYGILTVQKYAMRIQKEAIDKMEGKSKLSIRAIKDAAAKGVASVDLETSKEKAAKVTEILGGKAAEGFLHTTFPYDPTMSGMSAEAKRFTDAWKAAYPDKETNVNGALGYNTYFLIVDAIRRANSAEPKAIAKALAETKDLPTALGKLSINASHDAEMPVGIIEYKNGKRVYVGEVTPK